jgi:hypothetical protein
MAALDKDKDGTLSADEINGAKEALMTLDKDSDGKLAGEEVHPKPPRPPRDRMAHGDRERGERGPGNRGPGRPGKGKKEGRGPDGPPMGPPNPERLVDEAMTFDSDGDEKLDREELMQFAEEIGRRRGRGPRPPGAEGPDDDGPRHRRHRPGDGPEGDARPPRPDDDGEDGDDDKDDTST